MPCDIHSARIADPGRDRLVVGQVLFLVAIAAAPELALAQVTMPGQQLLLFARNYIIAPIALFAIVVSRVAAFVPPDLIKRTGCIAIIAHWVSPPPANTVQRVDPKGTSERAAVT